MPSALATPATAPPVPRRTIFRFSGPRLRPIPRAAAETPNDPEWRAIHRVADALVPELRDAFLAAVRRLGASIVLADLAAAIEALRDTTENPLIEEQLERLARELLGAETKVLRDALTRAAEVALAAAPIAESVKAGIRFDVTNPRAAEWVRQHAAELVSGVTDETKAAIRALVQRGFEDGVAPRETARKIRALVGLTQRDAIAAENLRARLLEEGKKPAKVDEVIERYAAKKIRQRALTIARTETITGASQGQLELWRQMADAGYLDLERARKRWIVTPDERLCVKVCKPMAKQERRLEEQFITGDGRKVMVPTVHPNCRCAVGLVFSD